MDTLDLWIDWNQGHLENGKTFGYIGANDFEDENGQYRGWFFTWPTERDRDWTADQIQAAVDSLDLDPAVRSDNVIPRDLAEQFLRTEIAKW